MYCSLDVSLPVLQLLYYRETKGESWTADTGKKAGRNSYLDFRRLKLGFNVVDYAILVNPTERVDRIRILVCIALRDPDIAVSIQYLKDRFGIWTVSVPKPVRVR